MQAKHIAAFCEPGPSHIQNTAAIGRELMRRGHRFTLFHIPALETRVALEGVPFLPLWATGENPGLTEQEQILYPVGTEQEGHSIKNFLSFAKASARFVCEAGPGALRAARVDGVIADMAQPGAAAVAEYLGLPYVTICHAVPLHRDAAAPPDFLPWTYSSGWWAKLRNVLAYRFRDLMIRPLDQVLNRYRKRWGLPEYRRPEDSFSPLAQITQLVGEFDFPRTNLPQWFHYVGPYRRTAHEQTPFPFERLNGRPLIYASLGTSRGQRSDLWRTIARGCAELDAQLVIALGGAARTRETAELPGAPLVVDYAPQIELLSRASVAITHAGLNTVMEALANAVPMIATPITGDQFGVAARLAYRGAGKVIHLKGFQAAAVKSALVDVLEEPRYRLRAADIRAAIEKTRGAERAAEIVEQAVSTGRPVF